MMDDGRWLKNDGCLGPPRLLLILKVLTNEYFESQNVPKQPKMSYYVSKHPKTSQSIPKRHKTTQNVRKRHKTPQKCLKTSLSIPKRPKTSPNVPKYVMGWPYDILDCLLYLSYLNNLPRTH